MIEKNKIEFSGDFNTAFFVDSSDLNRTDAYRVPLRGIEEDPNIVMDRILAAQSSKYSSENVYLYEVTNNLDRWGLIASDKQLNFVGVDNKEWFWDKNTKGENNESQGN